MRRRSPRPIDFALQALADTLEPPTLLAAVQRAWPDVAGAFAHVTEPVSERGGVVTVACDSSVLAAELDLMSEMVIDAPERSTRAATPSEGLRTQRDADIDFLPFCRTFATRARPYSEPAAARIDVIDWPRPGLGRRPSSRGVACVDERFP